MHTRIGWIALATLGIALMCQPSATGQTTHQHKDSGNYVVKRAYSHVESIREELERNPNAYGGHRQKAIEHLTKALEELDRAMWVDGPTP